MFNWMRKWAVVSAALFLAACGGSDDDHPATPGTVLQVAAGDARFSLLAEAVTKAELGAALSGTTPITVFAPTNDAFAALLSELGTTKDALFNDKPLLTAVLQYHVLGARVPASAVSLGQPVTPLAGGIFKIDRATGGGLAITDGRNRVAGITATDVAASNGVIHVIDKVLLSRP